MKNKCCSTNRLYRRRVLKRFRMQSAVDVKEVMEVLPKMLPMKSGCCKTMIWEQNYYYYDDSSCVSVREPLKQAAWMTIDNWISNITRGARAVTGQASMTQLRWWTLRCTPVDDPRPLWWITPAAIEELSQVATAATYGDQ